MSTVIKELKVLMSKWTNNFDEKVEFEIKVKRRKEKKRKTKQHRNYSFM